MNIKWLDSPINYLVVSLILVVTYYAYQPGLNGGYLLDDPVNLLNINVFANSEGFDAFIRYVFSYGSGLLKRPITTLTYLFNASSFPADAYAFKLTNLGIHLFNGLLLFFVTKKLLKLFKFESGINQIALITMAIWILHPYFVSTTLYVVQRMAMLPATFVLLGFWCYLKAKEVLSLNRTKGLIYLFLASFLCTVLAVLSKENGVILPIILLLLESYSFSQMNPLNKQLRWFFLTIPSLVILFAFIYKMPSFIQQYEGVDYTISERLLTESRVLVDYLYNLLIPSHFTEGVYTDGFIKSSSLFEPIATLFSMVFILILIISMVLFRKKIPLISFCVLFYFVTHIIESSFIALEFKFEHRNYLPGLFLFLPLSILFYNLMKRSKIYLLLVLTYLLMLAFLTHVKSNMWADTFDLTAKTSERYPQSIRAAKFHIIDLIKLGMDDFAIEKVKKTLDIHQNASLKMTLLYLYCKNNKEIIKDDYLNYLQKITITNSDRGAMGMMFSELGKESCIEDSMNFSNRLISVIKGNTGYRFKNIKQTVNYYEAKNLFIKGHIKESERLLHGYIESYQAYQDVLSIVGDFIDQKYYQEALNLLYSLERKINKPRLFPKGLDYNMHISKLRKVIESNKI